MKIQPFFFIANKSFHGEEVLLLEHPYLIIFQRNNNISQSIYYAPLALFFKIPVFHYSCKSTSKLRVTPRIRAKRHYLSVANINIGILMLCVFHQRQTTTERLHFHVLRLDKNLFFPVLDPKQPILLEDDIILVHRFSFCSHTTKRKVQALPVAILRYRQTPITIQQGSPHLWCKHSLSCRDGYIPLIWRFSEYIKQEANTSFSNMSC